jgi:SAM-dependent methyltransferase
MVSFGAYARYYDLMYRDKRYDLECDFLEAAFGQLGSRPVSRVLDLGCGTGGHALLLARRGYVVTGVDRSAGMLAAAAAKVGALPGGRAPRLLEGDIRTLELGERFDAAAAMFAVMSYMPGNDDLVAALRAVRRHLSEGGLFVLDGWYGPGVLCAPPVDRLKVVENGAERVMRFAHPVTDHEAQTVDVHYHVVHLLGDRVVAELDEVHTMRFLFPQEIAYVLSTCGFALRRLCEFPELDTPLRPGSWIFGAVAQAV